MEKAGYRPQETPRAMNDNVLTFDKLTDVFNSGTMHEEDQPCHLHVADTDVCRDRCTLEYGNPCQYFCPATVYEPRSKKRMGRRFAGALQINFANCVHCKTCDITDPYQIITGFHPRAAKARSTPGCRGCRFARSSRGCSGIAVRTIRRTSFGFTPCNNG